MRAARVSLLACLLAPWACAAPKHNTLPSDAGPLDAGTFVDSGTPDSGTPPTDAGAKDAGGEACTFSFDYPQGYPCNTDSDCSTHHCAFALPGASGANTGFCTLECEDEGSVDECPSGFICDAAYSVSDISPVDLSFGYYCMPEGPTTDLPGNRTLPVGSPCASGNDCAGENALCVNLNYGSYLYSFCEVPCSTSAGVGCPACTTCQNSFDQTQQYCFFTGGLAIGAPCVHHSDCSTFLCEGFCSQVCSTENPCPTSDVCETFVSQGQTDSLCVAPSQVGGTADGDPCLANFQCKATSTCLTDPSTGESSCTSLGTVGQSCTDSTTCATGLDCREFAPGVSECSVDCGTGCEPGQSCYAPTLATELFLYDTTVGGAGFFLTESAFYPSSDPGVWSQIPGYEVSAGTYWVSVQTNSGVGSNYVGNYQLLITDGTGTPVPWRALPNTPVSHGTLTTAQAIPFPVNLAGSITTPSQVDYYEFNVPSFGPITIEVLPGPPSACLPSDQVGQQALGESCTATFNCVSGLTCSTAIQACTMSCSTNADCGGDGNNVCETTSSGMVCATPAQIGQVAPGAQCEFDWQCATGGLCVIDGTSSLCAAPCSSTTTCDARTECGEAPDTQDAATLTMVCLPLGQHAGTFGASCNLQSDCATGLTCTAHQCAQSCQTSANCASPASSSLACQPCQSTGDCTTSTEEGLCTTIDPNEQYCVLPCDLQGKCPASFQCVGVLPTDGSEVIGVCEPVDGSCHALACDVPDGGTSGMCAIPPTSYAEPCQAASDCATGTCTNGLCTKACQSSADCGCPDGDLVCTAGTCQVTTSYAIDTQPNNSVVTAQPLTGSLPLTVYGTVGYTNGAPDEDFYSVALTAGSTVSFVTRAVCGTAATGAQTNLYVYNSFEELVTDSIYTGNYAHIHDYAVPATGTYVVQVEEGSFTGSAPRSGYILEITAASSATDGGVDAGP
jgi:hypothetical protein